MKSLNSDAENIFYFILFHWGISVCAVQMFSLCLPSSALVSSLWIDMYKLKVWI